VRRSCRKAEPARLVGDQRLRCEALFLEQLAHQPECRLRIAPALHEHLEDFALMVDGAPQVPPLPGDPNDHLVEVPSRARAWAALLQLTILNRAWLFVMRAYLIVAAALVVVRIVPLATSGD
jgi:hypothetical protein